MIRFKSIAALAGFIAGCGVLLGVTTAHAEWLSPDWKWRIEFGVAEGSIAGSETFADFTLLLMLDPAEFGVVFAYADTAGSELAITGDDGSTVFDHEVVSFDRDGQTAEIWFRVPQLSQSQRSFFLYFDYQPEGGTGTYVTSAPGDAWSMEHLAVYHFAEDPSLGTLKDWGPFAHDAVAAERPSGPLGPGWESSDLVTGAIGDGWLYDGVDQYTYASGVAASDSSLTVSAWFANSQAVDKGALAFQALTGFWKLSFQRRGGAANADLATQNGNMAWLPKILDGSMHHYTWVLDADADTARFFFDGVERAVWTLYTPPGGPDSVWTGEVVNGLIGVIGPGYFNDLDLADGVADEFRLIEGVRSPDWILTEHRNQLGPNDFFEVMSIARYSGEKTGLEDPVAGIAALGRITVSPNPFNAVAHIAVEMPDAQVTVQVYDMRGRLVRTLARSSSAGADRLQFIWDGCDEHGTGVGNGMYFIRARSEQAAATRKALLVR